MGTLTGDRVALLWRVGEGAAKGRGCGTGFWGLKGGQGEQGQRTARARVGGRQPDPSNGEELNES